MKLDDLRQAHLRAWVPRASWLATALVAGTVVVAQGGASITIETIRQRLSDSSASARRTFILSLADLGDQDLTDPARTFATRRLLHMYRQDPDPGTHSAIGWLLGHDRQGERRRALAWGQAEALGRIERDLAGRSGAERDWFVTTTGQTMTVVRGPVEFVMGSPPEEAGRTPDEARHRVRIPRSFAIATTEVTVAQFEQFLDANPEVKAQHVRRDNPGQIAAALQRLSPDDDGPRTMMTWYEAAMYCNWLSQQAGLPESEWIYPTEFLEIADGMVLPDDHLHRLGYRLPTEAEWEYAARAGAGTARFYGESEKGLDQFAWYAKNPIRRKGDVPDPADPRRAWPVGQLEPNGLGLFDVYGNVWEWVHDRARDYATGVGRLDAEDPVLVVSDEVARTRRGGSFPYGADVMRSAHRGGASRHTYFPSQRRDTVGFRVAKTVVDAPEANPARGIRRETRG